MKNIFLNYYHSKLNDSYKLVRIGLRSFYKCQFKLNINDNKGQTKFRLMFRYYIIGKLMAIFDVWKLWAVEFILLPSGNSIREGSHFTC